MVEFQRLGVHFQRVNVEEVLPVQCHAAEHRIVERTLHHIGVLAVGLHLQHSAGEHHQPNGGTAFGIHRVVG